MAGTVQTLRLSGIPSGYPAEIDAGLKIRWVDENVVNLSDYSIPLLKYFGGFAKFTFNQSKIEWVEDDLWNRRPTHGGLASGASTSLTVTGQAHRYPVGTILLHVPSGEYVRVTGHPDGNTLTITRDITSSVTEGAWASTDEVIAVGVSFHETDDWVYRPTSLFGTPYNLPQIFQAGVQVTFRRMETAIYGLRGGNDLDHQTAQTVSQMMVKIDGALAHGTRFAGSSTPNAPAMMGGLRFFVSSSVSGSKEVNLGGNALTRKDIDDALQDLYYAVGPDNMARTIICSAWAKRKITSFFSAAERLGPGANVAGVAIDRFMTDFGPVDVLLHTELAKNELYIVKQPNHMVGHHGQLGRPHVLQPAAPSATGPRVQRAFYADISSIHKGAAAEARIYNFSTSS